MPVESSRPPRAGKKNPWVDTQSFGMKIIFTLFGILLAYLVVLTATAIRNNLLEYDFIGKAPRVERTLMLEGEGRVIAAPDVAVVSMGMRNEGGTVAEAQQKNTETMNRLSGNLRDLGVDSADMQTTGYAVYPKTKNDANDNPVPDGFAVEQVVTVKVRDLAKVGEVFGQAGSLGLNSVGGVEFKIDNPDIYRSQARDLALRKVNAKAIRLSRALGVRPIAIVSYNEYEPNGPIPYGIGGPFDAEQSVAQASVETGSTEVVMRVTVTYEIE